MQTVKAIKALPGHQEGSIFSVDENSAKSLLDRELVEFVDDDAREQSGVFVTTTTRLSGAAVTQVAAADYPTQHVVGEPAEGEDGEPGVVVDGNGVTHTGTLPADAPTKSSTKADLVAFATGKVKHDDGTDLTEAELESLTKPELATKLNLD